MSLNLAVFHKYYLHLEGKKDYDIWLVVDRSQPGSKSLLVQRWGKVGALGQFKKTETSNDYADFSKEEKKRFARDYGVESVNEVVNIDGYASFENAVGVRMRRNVIEEILTHFDANKDDDEGTMNFGGSPAVEKPVASSVHREWGTW